MSADGVDLKRRRLLTGATGVVGAVGAAFVAVPFVASWTPSARARAIGAPVRVDIAKLDPGQMMRETWRGKPVWIVRRTEEQLSRLDEVQSKLRDPDSSVTTQQPSYAQNETRAIKPEYLVLVGLCTHLGCSPTYVRADEDHELGSEWRGGFFCPCHGSRFDLAGRVYQGVPAPTNLEVPPHHYVSENVIEVGTDPGDSA